MYFLFNSVAFLSFMIEFCIGYLNNRLGQEMKTLENMTEIYMLKHKNLIAK